MKLAAAGIGGLALLAFASAPGRSAAEAPHEAIPAIVRDVTAGVGFEDADLERVWQGEIVSRSLAGRSEREIAIAVVMRLRESHRGFYERVRRGQLFEIDRTVLFAEEIPPTSRGAAAFARLELEEAELRALGRAEPGGEFNLSRREIDTLRKAASTGRDAVLDAYREVLAGRLEAYREGGIEGVAPYAHGGRSEARPAHDLRLGIASLGGLADRCPTFYGSFAEFPDRSDPNVEHQLFWAVQRIQDRPTVILSHWALQLHEEFAVVGERQFYVGQGYDALLGAFALGEGESIVFYVNRTSTGQVTGLGSSVARALGGRMMLREVTQLFRQIRASVDAGEAPR